MRFAKDFIVVISVRKSSEGSSMKIRYVPLLGLTSGPKTSMAPGLCITGNCRGPTVSGAAGVTPPAPWCADAELGRGRLNSRLNVWKWDSEEERL